MSKRTLVWAVCAGAALCSGCGTMLNTAYLSPSEGGERVYGGVRTDWQVAAEPEATPGWVAAIFLADLPLSLAADTLTLPYVLALGLTKGQSPNPNGQAGDGWATSKTGKPATEIKYDRLNGSVGP